MKFNKGLFSNGKAFFTTLNSKPTVNKLIT
jgi:hypothetical protein